MEKTCEGCDESFSSFLKRIVTDRVKYIAGCDSNIALTLVARNKNLKDGDFIVYMPPIRRTVPGDTPNLSDDTPTLSDDNRHIFTEEKCEWALYGKSVQEIDKSKYIVRLNRPQVFASVISETLKPSNDDPRLTEYTATVDMINRLVVMINCAQQTTGSHLHDNSHNLTLTDLRLLAVCQHIQALLHSQRVESHFVHYSAHEKFNEVSMCGLSLTEDCAVPFSDRTAAVPSSLQPSLTNSFTTSASVATSLDPVTTDTCISTLESIVDNCYISHCTVDDVEKCWNKQTSSASCSDTCPAAPCSDTCVVLNAKQFLADTQLAKFYHGNLSQIKVTSGSILHEQLVALDSLRLRAAMQRPTMECCCIHVCNSRNAYQQQQVDIAWQILLLHNTTHSATLKQVHVVVGDVLSQCDQQTVHVEQFFTLRRKQVTDAFNLKYGEQVKGSSWQSTIDELVKAVVRFELLSTVCHRSMKVNMSDTDADSRGAVFVMYNCARLATLFTHFNEAVERGEYTTLPDVTEIDWSKLYTEEEWQLLFTFVLPFPSLVAECIEGIYRNSQTRSLYTHKVCQYLLSLSSCLSSYYSKTHILTESRVHLLPVVHARLYLMKAVQRVMHNALGLLGIAPLAQL